MAEVKVLIEGYAKESDEGLLASCSTVLIKDSGKNILVDPGCNPELLIKSLKKENLELKDIDLIFLTHYHIDHVLNIRLFPNTDVLDGGIIYRNDLEIEFEDKISETNIKFIDTPGHAHEQASLIVETKQGKIVIASDLFWWPDKDEQKTDYESLINLKDPYMKNEQELKESRKKVLEIADYIIPGHGKMFKVERNRPESSRKF